MTAVNDDTEPGDDSTPVYIEDATPTSGRRFLVPFVVGGLVLASAIAVVSWQSATSGPEEHAQGGGPQQRQVQPEASVSRASSTPSRPAPDTRRAEGEQRPAPVAGLGEPTTDDAYNPLSTNLAPLHGEDPYLPPNSWGGSNDGSGRAGHRAATGSGAGRVSADDDRPPSAGGQGVAPGTGPAGGQGGDGSGRTPGSVPDRQGGRPGTQAPTPMSGPVDRDPAGGPKSQGDAAGHPSGSTAPQGSAVAPSVPANGTPDDGTDAATPSVPAPTPSREPAPLPTPGAPAGGNGDGAATENHATPDRGTPAADAAPATGDEPTPASAGAPTGGNALPSGTPGAAGADRAADQSAVTGGAQQQGASTTPAAQAGTTDTRGAGHAGPSTTAP
ncbi:hypothetical protein [Corynebacterium bovis]|uniref:hypothetical protein n=1 Tax=Corynebacterium bovis TaxID=36808 RepID=UPI003139A157